MSCPTDFIASVTTASSPMPIGPTTLHWPAGSSPYPTQLRRAGRAITPKMVATTETGMPALAAAGGLSSPRPSNPDASPASGPSPRSGSIAHEQHPVVTAPIAPPVRPISRRQLPHSADGTLSLDLGRQNTDPSARRHGAHATHANQNHRPRYPFKPAVPSESGQVAQNLALNPHRPTLPQAHTPPAVSSFDAFRTPALRGAPRAVTGRHPKTLNDSGRCGLAKRWLPRLIGPRPAIAGIR